MKTGHVHDCMWAACRPTESHIQHSHTFTLMLKSAIVLKFSVVPVHLHRHKPPTHSGNKPAEHQIKAPHGLMCKASLFCFLMHVCWINYFSTERVISFTVLSFHFV